MERRPLPLPDAMDALKAVLDERFDLITSQFEANTKQFELLHRAAADALAAIANVKSEVLQDRAETAQLTSQVRSQNGNVAETMRRIAALEKASDTAAIEKQTIDHVKVVAMEAVKFASGGSFVYILHLLHVLH